MLDLGLLGLANPWLLTALVSLPVLWWLLRIIPPAPQGDALSGDPLPARPRARGGDLGAHAALAADPAPGAGDPADPGARRAGAQSGARAVRRRAAGAGGRRRLGGGAGLGTADRRAGALRRARAARRTARSSCSAPRPIRPAPTAAAAERRRRGAHGRRAGSPSPGRSTARPRWRSSRARRSTAPSWSGSATASPTSEAARAAAIAVRRGAARIGPLRIFADPAEQRAMLLLPPDAGRGQLVVARAAAEPGRRAEPDACARVGPDGEILARQTLAFDAGATRAPRRGSSCRSSCATRSPGSSSSRRAASAAWSCSTSAGATGWSAWSASRRPRPRSRCCPSCTTSSARWRRMPSCAAAAIAELLAGGVPAIVLTDSAQIGPDGAHPARRAGSRPAACCCASPARASPTPRTSWCRSSCGAAIAISAARCPGRGRCRSRASTTTGPLADLAGARGRRRRAAPGAGAARARRSPPRPGRGSPTARR